MKLETIVIHLDTYINNFYCLGDVFELDNKKIVFTNELKISNNGSQFLCNADYFIYGPFDPNYRKIFNLFKDKALFINRMNKEHQQQFLIGCPHIKPINTYKLGESENKYCSEHVGKLVIKPIHGARGIGQFVLDSGDLMKWVTSFKRFKNDHLTGDKFLEDVSRYSTYYSRKENFKDEGLKALKEEGYIVQKYLENIKTEFRGITDINGELVYLQERIRSESEYPQATGSDADNTTVRHYKTFPNGLIFDKFKEIAKYIGPLQSIDFGVLENEEVVVFEYCNQFGLDGVPYSISQSIHMDAIRQLIGDSPSAPEIIANDKKPDFFSWFNQIKEYRKDLTIEEFRVEYLAVGDISEDDIAKNMDSYILNLRNIADTVGYFEWCSDYGITKPLSDIDLIKKLYPLFSEYQYKNMLHYANYINHIYGGYSFIKVLKEFSSVANVKILCKLAAYKDYTDINIAPIRFKEWVKTDE